VSDRVREVGVQHERARARGQAHGRVADHDVVGVAVDRGGGMHDRVGVQRVLKCRRELRGADRGRAVLVVEQAQVARPGPRDRQRFAVLGLALAHARRRVGRSGDPVPPPDRSAGRGCAGEDVHDGRRLGPVEHAPARQDGVVEVRREHRVSHADPDYRTARNAPA